MSNNKKISLDIPDLRKVAPTGHWASDMWVIPHNGLKIEFRHMFKALKGLIARGSNVNAWDVGQFIEWWKFLDSFLHESHSVTSNTILLWMANKKIFPEEGNEDHKKLLTWSTRILQTYTAKLVKEDPLKIVEHMVPEVCKFSRLLFDHFYFEETKVAALVRLYSWDVDKDVEKLYWTKMQQEPHGNLVIAISLQWMDKKALKKFSKDHLGFFGSMRITKSQEALLEKHRQILKPLYETSAETESSSDSELVLNGEYGA